MTQTPKETGKPLSPKKEVLTPYQGLRRCFGQYNCPKCRRSWMSSNSWANSGQFCRNCNTKVYAAKQWPLRNRIKSVVTDKKIAHPQELCEKCITLGHYCRLGGLKKRKKT